MWSAPLILVLELPPLAFGPALPPKAFAPPRELTCAIRDLGRIQPPLVPSPRLSQGLTLDARGLSSAPRPQSHMVHRRDDRHRGPLG